MNQVSQLGGAENIKQAVEIVNQSCINYKNTCYSLIQSKFIPDLSCAHEDQEHNDTHIVHDLNYEIKDDHICNVCGIQNRSFHCKDCKSWIHDECKDVNEITKCNYDEHVLSLFVLPEEYQRFKLSCDVCHKKLQDVHWVYNCRPCRFFVHVHCAADNKTSAGNNIEPYSKVNIVQLPVANAAKLTSRFLKQNGLLTISRPEQIVNFHNNDHLLLLSNNKSEDELVCDGCIGSIVDKHYYSCNQCSYFLHVTCSKLPRGLELLNHPSHLDHTLHINHPKYCFTVTTCSQCQSETNGWSFECSSHPQFRLDMKCTLLPTDIAHKAHRHPLIRISESQTDHDCSACGKSLSGSSLYSCEKCCFFLGIDCALLPLKFTHKWDEHPLLLMYPPFPNHPDDFLCEICEENVNPKHWIYHCKECDQSFHPRCISRLSENRNIKFGGNIQIAGHSLNLVEKGTYKSQCGGCEKPVDKENVLQCPKCDLHICRKCGFNNLEDVTTISSCNRTLGAS